MKVAAGTLQVRQVRDQRREVTGFGQCFGESDIFVIKMMPARKLYRLGLVVIAEWKDAAARIQNAPRRNSRKPFRIVVLEQHRRFGETVQVRTIDPLAPVRGQIVRAEGIGNEQDQIQAIALLLGRLLPVRASAASGLRGCVAGAGKTGQSGQRSGAFQ